MVYETVQGDTWDAISLNVYGSEMYTDVLLRANRSHVRTLIFSSGIKLEIPVIDTVDQFEDLPPWKRGTTDVST